MTGFDSKRRMAADKFIAAEERKVGERYGYVPKLHPNEWMDKPAQEPVAQGSKEHLKIMMEHSAWDDRLELSDALANIDEFYATAPPKREWVELSDADIRETIDSICQYSGDYDKFLCKKIEQKIKELNT